MQCRLLGVSPSGFYAWRSRALSARSRADAALANRIGVIHERSRKTYGAPRVHAELAAQGVRVGRKRVSRLMREGKRAGISRRKGCKTTRRDRNARPAPDLVDRNFIAESSNRLWVADITCVPTWAGFVFLAVVLDAYSRRIVGWAMADHLRTELRPSMGSVGDAYDNAMCESFFATLECELLDRNRFRTRHEAQLAIFDFIEGWYNPHRRHSALGYHSPIVFEKERDAARPQLFTSPPNRGNSSQRPDSFPLDRVQA